MTPAGSGVDVACYVRDMARIGAGRVLRARGARGSGLRELVLEGEGTAGEGALVAGEIAQGSGYHEVEVHASFVDGA